MRWQDIPGWLTEEEGSALQSLVRDKRVLELGTYRGRSTACMAAVASHVTTVDKHEGEASDQPGRGTHTDALENLLSAGVLRKVSVHKCDFADHPPGQYDAVFIDGAHDVASAERDTKTAQKTGAPLIIYHDSNYPEVVEGAERAGLDIRIIGGGVGVGVPKPPPDTRPKVVMVMPRYGPTVDPGAAKMFWHEATLGEINIVAWLDVRQSIAYAFNAALAQALDWRDQGMVDHIVMQHADVIPKVSGWADILWREKQATGADVVSCVIPIKDDVHNPRTSTAIHDLWNPWFPKRYINLGDRTKTPETFGPEHVCGENEILSLNTGLWIADLRKPWWDSFNWSLTSRIIRLDGKRVVQMKSEDWEWARHLYDNQANVRATWKIPIDHMGDKAYPNYT